jgi:hypothetical protein
MSVTASGPTGDGFAPGAPAVIGLPPHSITGCRSSGTRITTTRVVQTVLAS